MKKVQHEKSATWKKSNIEKVQHENSRGVARTLQTSKMERFVQNLTALLIIVVKLSLLYICDIFRLS